MFPNYNIIIYKNVTYSGSDTGKIIKRNLNQPGFVSN